MKKIISLITFVSFSILSFGNPPDSIRIQLLEKKLAAQDSLYAKLNPIKSFTDTLSDPFALIGKLAETSLWIALTFALLGGIIWLLNKLKLFKDDWHMVFIQRLVEKYEEVNVLKKTKQVLVVSSKSAVNNDFVTSILKEFTIVEEIAIDADVYQAPTKKFDIIFANNEDAKIKQEVWEEYLTKHPSAYLFYFGLKFDHLSPNIKRVSFANARAQIYSNLISILKFHYLTRSKVENN
jgi:hypothetical protein